MYKTEKISEKNKQLIIDYIKTDVVKHVFAYYDIQHEPEHTMAYAAFKGNILAGYILIYTALEFPSVILEGEDDAAKILIQYAPQNHFIMHCPPKLLRSVKERFPQLKYYFENWMLVKKEHANHARSELVRRLNSKEDAEKLCDLLTTRAERPSGTAERYLNWIKKMILYGVFIDDKLVSYAGSFLQLPQVWMIGGVYTHPDHRNKGYSTLATSAMTEEALKHAEAAALFVRSDNYAAIRVYEKIGYRQIGEKLWVDVGTGLKP